MTDMPLHAHSAATRGLTETERLARLRLIRTDRIGPITFRQLMMRFGTAVRALDAVPDLSARGGKGTPLSPPPATVAERELEALDRMGGEDLHLGTAEYPARLAELDDAPPVLLTLGRRTLLKRDIIGVVGARNASVSGIRMAERLASDLGDSGLVIASGLARGIDTASHRASFNTGTIACIAGGLDIAYPRENAELQAAIAEKGLLVSEMPPGTRPQARHFPRRNRIIAGLSLGVLVIEAAQRSGSLITARLAAEAGREVFAIPGSPMDPRSRGTNRLIRDGAVLTETADDILEELASLHGGIRRLAGHQPAGIAPMLEHVANTAPVPAIDDAERKTVFDLLSPGPCAVDDLVRLSGLASGAVLAALLELELAGSVQRHPGNRVSRLETS